MKKIELISSLIVIACGLVMYAVMLAAPYLIIGYIVYDILKK